MKVFVAVLALAACAYGASITNIDSRIVGGDVAAEGQFPYMVSFRYNGKHTCGASILDETTILTAAHCVDKLDASLMTIMAGSNKLNGGDVYEVASYVVHPYFTVWYRNVALLKLKTPIRFSENVQAVELRQEDIAGGEDCTLSGWGTTSYPGNMPNDLHFIQLKTLSFEDCKAKLAKEVLESEVCTLTKRGEGTCHGDAGSPLVDAEGRQFGVMSWGMPCALGSPDVYTRLFSFLDWIEKNRY